jgi:diguanylate cyclase (GGDEF)-like protein
VAKTDSSDPNGEAIARGEIVRLNKIIEALMNRAERSASVGNSDFGLFETAVVLEGEVRQRTAELQAALQENERMTWALEEANRRLELLSTIDPLTGLANRRRFAEVLAAEWSRALRSADPLGAVMVDVDRFKLYNDRYGHLAGDACLKRVALALSANVRAPSDLVARFGGEEFSIILPGADQAAALLVGERVRRAVAELAEPHLGMPLGIVTISVGTASTIPVPDGNADRLLDAADAALYQAKDGGRNQVVGVAAGSAS